MGLNLAWWKNYGMAGLGLVMGLAEVILTVVFQFQLILFVISFVVFGISCVYFY